MHNPRYASAAISVVLAAVSTTCANAADDPVSVSFRGYAKVWLGASANQSGRDYGGSNIYNGDLTDADHSGGEGPALHGDVKVSVIAATQLADDLRLNTDLDLSPTINKLTANETMRGIRRGYATLSGGFGALSGGRRENIGALFHIAAPTVSGIGGQDGYWWEWVVAPTGHRGLQRTYAGDDEVNAKVIYLTPEFHGLEAGVSYTPDLAAHDGGVLPSTAHIPGQIVPSLHGGLSVYSLTYHHSFDDVGLKADFGSGRAGVGGLSFFQGGVQIGYRGWIAGGSVLRRQVRSDLALFKDALGQGRSWDMGISYSLGPYSLAVNYFTEQAAKGDKTDVNAAAGGSGPLLALGSAGYATDHDRITAIEARYAVNPDLFVTTTLFQASYVDGYGVTAEENRGWGVLSGVSLKF